MHVLAIDTSSNVASVACIKNDNLLAEVTINNKKTHSQMLLPIIENLLDALFISLDKIELFAVAIGPGSFTGIRIGISTARAFAQAKNKPIVGVSSLCGLAGNLAELSGIICPMIDARNNQVYTSVFRSDGKKLIRINDFFALNVKEIAEILKIYEEPIYCNGDGSLLHAEYLKQVCGERLSIAKPIYSINKASNIAFLALEAASRGETNTYNDIVPMYLRKSQAEQKLEETVNKKPGGSVRIV